VGFSLIGAVILSFLMSVLIEYLQYKQFVSSFLMLLVIIACILIGVGVSAEVIPMILESLEKS
jgi:hypothetical protein